MNKLLLILFFLPIIGVGQGNFFWSHTANIPVYNGNTFEYVYTNCSSIATGFDLNHNRVFENYAGETKDSIKIVSFNNNYDGDSYYYFELLDSFDGDSITLPFQITINGFLDNQTYPDIAIRYNNRIDGVYILCNNHPQQCSFEFRIKDTNGLWGDIQTCIFSLDYNP
jgi:hypothetical protein